MSKRKKIGLWLVGVVSLFLLGAKVYKDNTLILGSGTASNKEIIFDKGNGATNPRIRFDNASNSIKATVDNTNFFDLMNDYVFDTGNQTIGGTKTFSSTISGSINGNAATVTTNANLTGDVTSSGNATAIASGVIVNADVNASAAIDATKLANGTISNTEFQYLNGVTSDIQTQINTRLN